MNDHDNPPDGNLNDRELTYLAGHLGPTGRRAAEEIRRWRSMNAAAGPVLQDEALLEAREKLRAAHQELARRHRRDQELARAMPAITARLMTIAVDASLDLHSWPRAWDKDPSIDPSIDWTGIDGGGHR